MDKENTSPIFVGGMFKSGTSLLRAMLGNHSLLASGLETYWFEIDWCNLKSRHSTSRLEILKKFYDIDNDDFNKIIGESVSSANFLDNLMRFWMLRLDKTRWVEKTPGNIHHIEKILNYWPEATIIHIIRDPRDIFASLKEAKKWDSVDEFIERWAPLFNSLNEIKKDFTNLNNSYFEIRYEDLVSDPKRVMRNISGYLGIPFEIETANFMGDSNDFEKVKKITGKESTTLKRLSNPIESNRVGIWEKTVTINEIALIEQKLSNMGLIDTYREVCFK